MTSLYIIPISNNIYNITENVNITQHLLQLEKYCPHYTKYTKYTQFKLIPNYKEIQKIIQTEEDFNFLHLINIKFKSNYMKDRWYTFNDSEKENLIQFISDFIEIPEGGIITENTEYKCSTCNKIYETNKSLKRHISTCNKTQLYNCTVCNKKFNSNQCFRTHSITCISLECKTCGKELSSKQSFENHTKNCGHFKCEKCNNAFNSKYKYISHCSKTHGFTPIV
jgi:uncharacterized C2H2 Zn-finger protein/ribosomal protein L33